MMTGRYELSNPSMFLPSVDDPTFDHSTEWRAGTATV
jgi:hypothetical protein